MYTSYTTAALTLRAKTSYTYTHVSLFNDRPETCNHCFSRCCCAPSSDLSIYTIPLHPKFIYGYCLRQSALIHCSPSRSFFSARARYPCLPLRGHRTSGSYREVIGLLADIEGGEIGIKSVDEESRRSLRRENVRCRSRRGGVISTYYPSGNSSLSSDFESKGDRRPKAARAYSSGWSKNRYEASGADDFESETEEVEKYEDVGRDLGKRFDSRERRDGTRALSSRNVSEWEDRDRRERVESSASLDNKSRGGYVQEEQRVNRQGSRDGSKKLNFRSEVRRDDVKRSSSLRDMESNSASVVKHLGKVDQRVVGSSDLSSTYTKLKDTSTTPSSYTKRVSDSRRHIESEIDEGVVGSTDSSSSYTKLKDTSIISGNYTKRGSDSRRRIESEIDERVVGSTESSSSHTKLKETSTIPSSYTKRVSGSRSHIEDERLKDWVDTSTSLQYSVVGGDKRVQMEHEAVDISELNQQHENRTNVIRNHASNTVTDVMQGSSKTIVETRMGGQKHNSTSTVSLVQGASDRSEQRKQIDEHVSGHYTSKRALEKNTKLDELSKVEVERVSNSQKISDTRVERENYSTSSVNVVHGTTEKQSRTDSGVDHLFSSRRTSERDTRSSVISSSEVERVSNSFARIETQKENSSRLFVRDKKDKQSTVVGVSSQASSGIADHSSSFSRTHIQALDDQTSRDETDQSSYSRLESASRLDKSSALYIGEFADKLRQEIITADEIDNPARNSSMLDATESTKIEKHKEEGARQSSSRSGMKGPPVEMWDVRDPHADEPSRPEEPEEDSLTMVAVDPTTSHSRTDNQITRRSHKSLWTYISDVIRAGWVLRSGSHNSTLKLGTKSSSNESVSSEAWFSGHEPDENDDDTDMKGVDAATKESVQFESLVDPSNMRLHSAPSQASSEVSRQGNTETLSETSSSTSKSRTRRGSVSKDSFHESKSEELQGSEVGEGTLGIPFSATTIDQPSTPINFTISPTTDEGSLGIPFSSATIDQPSTPINFTVPPATDDAIIEIGNDRALRSGFVELEIKEKPAGDKLPEAGRTEVVDGELKRRKLQKNKQVLRERFDEWEEAYNRESEQRKLDELFMREALLEAKKAADTWEVPVGAVLVQNGKIIARGCNLVEEARDSTAHAEMICIREASSLLRTWRLAETTLYVTLEPCAMCAGAILQSRIDTVVWGAPNKLLGADGSWVRLFPGGDGGGNSSDTSIQIPGPVHPFHPKIVIRRGILATECSDIMQQFFQLRRRKKKTEPEQEAPSCLPIVHRTKLFAKMHDMFCIMFCL